MKAYLKSRSEIAEGTYLFDFDLKGKTLDFHAGQSLPVELIDPPYTDDKGNQRYFSIVNDPDDAGHLQIATRISDSAFKRSLLEVSPGAEAELGKVSGKFVLPEELNRNYIFLAGGIGITPFISMLRFVRKKKTGHKFTLVYSNRTVKSSAFLDELRNYEDLIPHFRMILTMTDDPDWEGEKRMVGEDFIKDYFPDYKDRIYMIVGPPGMVKAMFSVLPAMGIEMNQLLYEVFTGY